MAFECGINQQVRIRISREAEAILEDDMRSFTDVQLENGAIQINESKRGSLVNTILENFYEDALSSISLQKNKYETSIERTFKDKKIKIKSEDIKVLLYAHEEELVDAANQLLSLKKNSPWDKIRLRNDFYKYLTDEKTGSTDNKYYDGSLQNYLSTIIEEYARLPYIEREKIYYRPIFNDLQKAIDEQKQIIITKKDRTNYVIPYAIMPNPLSTYSYLVGYSYNENDNKNNIVPCSYRISGIQKDNYRIVRSKSAFLSKERIEFLHKQIAEKGVQFLSSELIEITVKFTNKGIENFYRQINLRPSPVEPVTTANKPYIFRCSKTQARYYFSQFGTNAEILDPPELRKDFKKKYHDANALYSKSPG